MEIIQKIKDLTGKEFFQFTSSGNEAIDNALDLAKQLGKTTVLIPDQAGWIHYLKAPGKFGLKTVEVKTNDGLIDLEDLKEKANENSVLLTCSMPGYFAMDDIEAIYKICKEKDCLLINDASGSIGTEKAKVGDLILCSFGKDKPLNAEYGGILATDEEDYFVKLKWTQVDQAKLSLIQEKLEYLPERLKFLKQRAKQITEDLKDYDLVFNEGINVMVKYKNEKTKNKIIGYCNENGLQYTECPRYIRLNTNAISIEVKRL